jgi:hypothetical protein
MGFLNRHSLNVSLAYCRVQQESDPKFEDKGDRHKMQGGMPGFYGVCSYSVGPREESVLPSKSLF